MNRFDTTSSCISHPAFCALDGAGNATAVTAIVAALCLCVLVPLGAAAQETKVLPNDPAQGDRFGAFEAVAVSEDGQRVIVGAPRADLSTTDQGAAYIFVRNGSGNWSQEATITGDNLSQNFPNFGSSVAIDADGNSVAVGAQVDDPSGQSNAGSAYVFSRSGSTWSQEDKLVASDPQADDFFGYSIGINDAGDRVIVGARFEDAGGNMDQGSAYVFTENSGSWSQEAKFSGGDLPNSNFPNFGWSVAINGPGDRAVVGAPFADPTDPGADNGNGTQDGSAYVFARSSGGTWSEEAKLLSDDYEPGDNFGFSVSIDDSGDRVVAGARFEDPNGNTDQGSAYVFTRSGSSWAQEASFTGENLSAANFPNFGWSVSINGNGTRVAVGAPYDDPTDPGANNGNGTQDGSAFVFTRLSSGSWTQEEKLLASDYAPGDNFGTAVSLSSEAGLVGAPFDDGNAGTDQGSAYVYGPTSIPVELAEQSFTVQRSNGSAIVSWRTLSESNNSGFELQRRTEAKWKTAAFVESKARGGNSSESLSYSHRLDDLEYGTHSFRLVQVDLDGSRTVVAGVRTIEMGLDAKYRFLPVRPNPVRTRGTVKLTVREQQSVTVTLHDALGRKVRVLYTGQMAGNNTKSLTVNAAGLASGMYFIRATGDTFRTVRKVSVAR
ncbi:MAG: T9SS type A sorting domain-containing protein [Salinibacter sp.]